MTAYVHEINQHKIAASELVPGSGVAIALGNKADKVSGATAGDIAALDANGNLVDSGISNVVQSAVMHTVNSAGVQDNISLLNSNDSTQVYVNETTLDEINQIIAAL